MAIGVIGLSLLLGFAAVNVVHLREFYSINEFVFPTYYEPARVGLRYGRSHVCDAELYQSFVVFFNPPPMAWLAVRLPAA